MEMTLRWYGSKFDTVTLEQIRQIPGVKGVITTLYDTQPGEVWSRERIKAMKDEVEAAGLHVSGIESVNVHDAIKTGVPEREQLKISEKRTYIWYVTILCLYLTGQGQSLQESVLTVLQYLHIIRMQLMHWTRRKCLIP